MVKKVQRGESIQVRTIRQAAEIRKDAFPNYVRSKYRGNLSEMPDIRGTYDWHIHGGRHSIPHLQIKTTAGRWIRIEVIGK